MLSPTERQIPMVNDDKQQGKSYVTNRTMLTDMVCVWGNRF